jgi:hypothetical protein
MALLSFVDPAPRAYWLKVSNACPPISTSIGTSPDDARAGDNYRKPRSILDNHRFYRD